MNSILTRALGNCDGVKVYQRLACDVYEKNEQFEVKIFSRISNNLIQFKIFCFRMLMEHLVY